MTGLKRSYGESSIPCNGFDSLLVENTSCGSARYDNIVKFLQRSMSGRTLVRRDETLVNINSLRGKIVGLFFLSLTPAVNHHPRMHTIFKIASAYDELSKSEKGQFEIVWIAKGDDYLQFHKYLEMMPWLAIPFTNCEARNSLWNSAGINNGLPNIFLFNREGKLFRKNAVSLFRTYGADWYPFTDARIREIREEDSDIRRNMNLKNLLGNATRDFVLDNNGIKVSISKLENEVVGILFCNIDNVLRWYFTPMLREVYMKLKGRGKKFEVVMVHTGGFCQHPIPDFKKVPWLSIPRADSTCNTLMRIFDPDEFINNTLVIVGKRVSFVNEFGLSAIESYGDKGYPFSRLSVVEIEKKKIEASVKSLLTCGYVIRKSGENIEKMPMSYLSGKTILLLLTDFCCSSPLEEGLVPNLIKWYEEIKVNYADFEVILFTFRYDEKSFDECYGQMPWLAFPRNHTGLDAVCSELFENYSTLAVFGPNRQLLSIGSEFHFYAKGSKAYPFSDKDVLMDMSRRLCIHL